MIIVSVGRVEELKERKGDSLENKTVGLSCRDSWLKFENEKLKEEKRQLKRDIQELENEIRELKEHNKDEQQKNLIAELQDQHQQDCIRINDLTTTIHVLAGLYSNLRKTVGMD